MPQTVAEADKYYARDWSKWPVPQSPDIGPDQPWVGTDPFWRDSIMHAPVDVERTSLLGSYDIPIVTAAGDPPRDGVSYGLPFQVVDTAKTMTKVYDKSKPITWKFLKPTHPITFLPLPLEPDKVRREGDPVGAFDKHWLGWDPTAGLLYEVIQLNKGGWLWGQADWSVGYNGASNPSICWDTKKPWNAVNQPRGVVAAGVPLMPLVVRYEEFAARNVGHAIFVAFPNYASARVGFARGYDGDLTGNYPVRAGERLRLKEEFVGKDDPIAYAAREYGLFVGDRIDHVAGQWSGTARYHLTQDGRWANVVKPTWRLSQFEVIAQ